MITGKKERVIIQKTELVFKNEDVLNLTAIKEGDYVPLFYRVVTNGNYFSIGYCKSKGPLIIEKRFDKAVIVSEFDYESHGVEDPGIVKLMTYIIVPKLLLTA